MVPGPARAGPETVMISYGDSGRLGMKSETDELLVRRVAEAGDEDALSELYERYSALVYGAGVRYLGDRELAEDLVQDVFLSVWRSAGSFDPARASFATWVYRITRNRATDLIRRRRARVRVVGEPFVETGGDDPAEELSRGFDVAAALSRLSPPQREVLDLAYFRGMSQSEISRHTGTPLGTVKSRTSAALRAMRDALAPEDDSWQNHER